MSDCKFRVDFLEDAKTFLDSLDEKSRDMFIIFGKQEVRMIKNFSRNYKTRFGNLEQSIKNHIFDFSLFEINLKVPIRL